MHDSSILNDIKRMLNVAEDDNSFDHVILTNINSAFMTVNQLGIGQPMGSRITGSDETWEDLFGDDPRLDALQDLVHLKVRILFDPPQTGPLQQAMAEQVREFEWRLRSMVEDFPWIVVPTVVVIEGG